MEPRPGHPEPTPTQRSEDELAREMIERIARQVDLETGRVPLETKAESNEDTAEAPVEEAAEAPAESPPERSDEDVSRELVERIAREVDGEPHG